MEKKTYYIELHATEIKDSAKHYATESCRAHFESAHKPATPEFVKDMKESISFYWNQQKRCLLYTSPSPRDGLLSRMPSSA